MTLPNPSPTSVVTGAYCNRADLLMGDVQINTTQVDVDAYIKNAAAEMDIALSGYCRVPITFQNSPENYVLGAFLRSTNAKLATGRLLYALATPIERDRVHAYGSNLIREAKANLQAVVDGSIVLNGLVVLPGIASRAGVIVTNQDDASGVDSFYARTMPGGMSGPKTRVIW